MVPPAITQQEQALIDHAAMLKSLENLEKNSMKQFAALVGVIMALIGAKLIATPWYVDVAVIASLVSSGFMAVTLIAWWPQYAVSQKATRIAGISLLFFSSVCQIWVYHPGVEVPPVWFAPIINVLMVLLALSMIWASWTQAPRNIKHSVA